MTALEEIYVRNASNCVYLYGTWELNNNKGDSVKDVKPNYVEACMKFAATNYNILQIENALMVGYITQAEYDATIALIPVTE